MIAFLKAKNPKRKNPKEGQEAAIARRRALAKLSKTLINVLKLLLGTFRIEMVRNS